MQRKEVRSGKWVAALIVVIGGIAIAWWLGSRDHEAGARGAATELPLNVPAVAQSAPQAQPVVRSAGTALPARDSASGAVATAAAIGPPLPPIDRPLREIVDELRARADAGDARAACRLASEMERCGSLPSRLARLSDQTRQHQRTIEGAIDPKVRAQVEKSDRAMELSHRAEYLLTESRHCEGVLPDTPAERLRRWRQAAIAGHGPSMRHYAAGNAFRWHDLLEIAESLLTYRGEAEEIARSAARNGDATVAYSLALAYSPPRREAARYFLAQSVDGDATEALALFRLLEARAVPDPHLKSDPIRSELAQRIDELEQSMLPAEVSAANDRATRYLLEWAPQPAGEQIDRWAIVNRGTPDIAPVSCNQPAGVPPAFGETASAIR